MDMTINEIIDDFEYIKHVGNGEFEYKHCREEIALDEAVIIMRKYQQIEQILKDIPYGGDVTVRRIQEVVEDGNDT